MPCYEPTARDEQRWKERQNEIAYHKKQLTHNSPVAEMLCSVMRLLDEFGIDGSPEVEAWWKEHQERDKKKNAGTGKFPWTKAKR